MTRTHIPADQLPRTGATQQAFALASAAGLAPHVQVDSDGRTVHRGAYTIIIMGTGEHTPLGTITVGASTGRILRGLIKYGNNGPKQRYTGAREVLTALRELTPDGEQTTHVASLTLMTDKGVEVCDVTVTRLRAMTPDVTRVRLPHGALHDIVNDRLRAA